jgi:hypothetical protein
MPGAKCRKVTGSRPIHRYEESQPLRNLYHERLTVQRHSWLKTNGKAVTLGYLNTPRPNSNSLSRMRSTCASLSSVRLVKRKSGLTPLQAAI